MSGGTIVVVVAIVVVAIIAALIVTRARTRRRAASARIGLPDLGALSTEGLDKEHTRAEAPSASAQHQESPVQP